MEKESGPVLNVLKQWPNPRRNKIPGPSDNGSPYPWGGYSSGSIPLGPTNKIWGFTLRVTTRRVAIPGAPTNQATEKPRNIPGFFSGLEKLSLR